MIFLFYLFLAHTIHLDQNLPFLHVSQSVPHLPSLPYYCFYTLIQLRAVLPGISIEHSNTRCNKARHKLLYQGWVRQSTRRKIVLRAEKRVRDTPTSKAPNFTTIVHMQIPQCRPMQTQWLLLQSLCAPFVSYLVDNVGCVLLVSSILIVKIQSN